MKWYETPLNVQWNNALLIAGESVYHMISDDDLLKYLKAAVRRFRHLQVLRALAYCAADEDERLERTRGIIAEVDAKLRE